MNRKRVLWPLVLAAAFGLGVLAAQVQAGAIFLPLVVRASRDPTSSGTVRVENVFYQAARYSFYGELVNETNCTVYAEKVALYLLDGEGLMVGTRIGYSMLPRLLPGQRTAFKVYWTGPPPAWESYAIYTHWYPIDRLTVDSAVISQNELGGWRLAVTVRNQLPVSLWSFAVGSVLYNSSGEVMDYYGLHEYQHWLSPGATTVVTNTLYSYDWDADMEPVDCTAFAVASENIGPWAMKQAP